MLKSLAVVPAILLTLAACTSGQSTTTAPPSTARSTVSTQPPPRGVGTLGVFYSLAGPDYPGHSMYRLALIASDGQTVASATPDQPPFFTVAPPACFGQPMCGGMTPDWLPLVSISGTRVYFLDGAGTVRWLRRDGTTGVALQLEVRSMQRAVFSVSPDDRRIAVALLDYSQPPAVAMHLTVRDLAGGPITDLLASSSLTEWPVGWHGKDLVLAVGDAGPHSIFGELTNPHGATMGYHLVDSQTGRQLATLGFSGSGSTGADCVSGPLESSGTACVTKTSVGAQGWDGRFKIFGPNPFQPADAGFRWPVLAPDGQRLTWETGQYQIGPVTLLDAGGTPRVTAIPGQPMGWLDDHRVIAVRYANQKGSFVIGDLDSGVISETGLPPDFRYFGPL